MKYTILKHVIKNCLVLRTRIIIILNNRTFAGQAHSSVERAGLFGGVKFRLLPVDDKFKLRGDVLAKAIREDKEKGLIPFYVSPA